MSRLIVKGLPKRLDEKELREIFSSAGQVTDAKIIRDKDGNSRQFAFVGYKEDKHAKNARKKLNGSYIRTSRVYVEMAKPTGDPSLPRPWSRHSKGSSAYEKRMQAEEREQVEKFRADARKRAKEVAAARKKEAAEAARNSGVKAISEKDKEGFQAFKDAVQGRKNNNKNPIWADAQLDSKDNANDNSSGPARHPAENQEESSDDDDVFDASNNNPQANEIEAETQEETTANPIALDSGVSDADYFKSKISSVGKLDDDTKENETNDTYEADDESEDESGEEKEEKSDESESKEKKEENEEGKTKKYGSSQPHVDAGTTGRLFVRNLAFSVTEGELERLFKRFGTLAEVHIVVDSTTKKSRGVALISYVAPENAAKALTELDGSVFEGRLLHILPGRPKPAAVRQGFTEGAVGSNKFKTDRDDARVESAKTGADGVAQNTMYMGADAVASAMAERLGTDKSTLLGTASGESGTAAVRLAVAEATLQVETREFFKQNGVDLQKAKEVSELLKSSSGTLKRSKLSKNAFFVKNLPTGTKEKHLEEIFGKFGTPTRLKVAPNSLLAFVEFGTTGEAKRAYGACAYKRFRNLPLYLEWVPVDAITYEKNENGKSDLGEEGNGKAENENNNNNENKEMNVEVGQGNNVNSGSVYVKNLNFDTRDDGLKRHFQKILKKQLEILKGLRSATVATKTKDKSGEKVSMGFGFVEFSSYAIAAEAVKIAQGSELDGHKLELRLSKQERTDSSGVKKRKRGTGGKACTKLMLRNVAFEAEVREVRELFAAFGQLKSVRLPRKMNGRHRGFGFIDFVSVQEAKNAKEALANAHLYGRHLVIEYADDDEGQGTSTMEKLVESATIEARKNSRKRLRMNDEAHNNNNDGGEDDDDARIRDELYAQ